MKELFVEPVSKEDDCLDMSKREKQAEARNKMKNTTQWSTWYVTRMNIMRYCCLCCCVRKTQKDLLEIKAYERLEKEVQITHIV